MGDLGKKLLGLIVLALVLGAAAELMQPKPDRCASAPLSARFEQGPGDGSRYYFHVVQLANGEWIHCTSDWVEEK